MPNAITRKRHYPRQTLSDLRLTGFSTQSRIRSQMCRRSKCARVPAA